MHWTWTCCLQCLKTGLARWWSWCGFRQKWMGMPHEQQVRLPAPACADSLKTRPSTDCLLDHSSGVSDPLHRGRHVALELRMCLHHLGRWCCSDGCSADVVGPRCQLPQGLQGFRIGSVEPEVSGVRQFASLPQDFFDGQFDATDVQRDVALLQQRF